MLQEKIRYTKLGNKIFKKYFF